MDGTQPLEITQGTDAWHVLDRRGVLMGGYPTHGEAAAFVAGYRAGRSDAAAIVRDQAAMLERVGRA